MSLLQRISALAAIVVASSAGAAPTGSDWSDARTLTVQLSSFHYDPATITLEHGVRYTLHVVNTSSGGHDFAAKEFFDRAQVAPQDAAKVAGGRIELDGGDSADIHLIAPAPGTYKVHCTHFMHSTFGMTGKIVVQ